ncbi:MAG: GMC family oxidoreductase N-terminal domain-containing protein [Streptosporangiaceae bacterium]|nr:GMC family oxidoreductase N-terminal domain-containing protein [Streptosporangiaceae bacterium]
MTESYDYIIVGGGTAGSVIASRLTDSPDVRVLVLEAGQREINDAVTTPWRWNEVLLGEFDWAYLSEPQPGLNDSGVYSAAGRGLGGTSNIYHMIHTRGRPADYDAWAYQGCAGWSHADVLPYFARLESQRDDTNPSAGRNGPITVVNARDTGSFVSHAFLEGCEELGYPPVADFNAESYGAGWHHVNIDSGRRWGARPAYLDPALSRPNLTTRTNVLASRLLIEGDRCTGVEYIDGGAPSHAYAEREVVVSAGAIQSPKLLMLSGIGPTDHLAEHDLPVQRDLPGVGQNFHDHPLVIGPVGYLREPGDDPRGNVTEVALFCTSQAGLPVPDLEICLVHRAPFGDQFFSQVIERVRTGQPVSRAGDLVDPHLILALPGLVRPYSRGTVRLADADPVSYPKISANYFAEQTDLDRMVQMVTITRDIYQTKPFAERLGLTEVVPGPETATRQELTDWVRANTGSYYHFVGSCRMGVDSMAVVDPQLRVHGVRGLRVADASVMPSIVSANPHTTVVMIAERAAEFLRTEVYQ